MCTQEELKLHVLSEIPDVNSYFVPQQTHTNLKLTIGTEFTYVGFVPQQTHTNLKHAGRHAL